MRGIHHLHIRKRLEPFPASTPEKRFLDRTVYIVSIIGPLMTIPQIVDIFSKHDATGVSLLTWSLYALFNIPWIIYGFVHKERPLIINYLIWLVVNLLVVAGVLLYS